MSYFFFKFLSTFLFLNYRAFSSDLQSRTSLIWRLRVMKYYSILFWIFLPSTVIRNKNVHFMNTTIALCPALIYKTVDDGRSIDTRTSFITFYPRQYSFLEKLMCYAYSRRISMSTVVYWRDFARTCHFFPTFLWKSPLPSLLVHKNGDTPFLNMTAALCRILIYKIYV